MVRKRSMTANEQRINIVIVLLAGWLEAFDLCKWFGVELYNGVYRRTPFEHISALFDPSSV